MHSRSSKQLLTIPKNYLYVPASCSLTDYDMEDEGDGCYFDDYDFDGEIEFENMRLVAFGEKKLQAALDTAANRILGPSLTKALALTLKEGEGEEEESYGWEEEKATKCKEKPTPSAIIARSLCDTEKLLGEDGIDEFPDMALFIFLRSTFQTARNRESELHVAASFHPAAVTPLDRWALTKVAFYLNLPFQKQEPAWYLAHCTSVGH